MPLENSNKKDKVREKERENLDENNYLVEESLIKIKEARSFSDFICMCVIAELNHNNYKPLSKTNEIAKEDWNDFDFILSQIKDGKLEIKLENGKLKFDVNYDKQEVKSSLLDLNDNLVYTRTYPYKQKNMEQEKNFPETISKDSKQVDSSKKGNFLTEEFDKDKNLYKIGNLKDGLKEGKWTFYYLERDRKLLQKEIEYKNGVENGKFSEFYLYGGLKKEGQYINGNKEGEWKTYDKDGDIILKESYKNGQLHGEFERRIKSHSIRIFGQYINGKREGKWCKTDDWSTIKLNYKDGVKDGKYSISKLVGMCPEEDYYPVKSFNGEFKNGRREGKWTFYYLEGELKEEREYKNGSRNGLCKEYSKEGKIERISNYKAGIKDGEYKEFDYNEKLCLEGTYSNGKKDGLWKNYETSEFLLYKDDMLIDKNSKDFFQTKESNFETHILSEKKEIESPWEKKIENDKAESFER